MSEWKNETEARDVLFETFKRWHELLATKKRGILPEEDVRGLIGEIQYMIDEIKTNKRTDITVIDAWKIHKDSSRDFVYDVDWSEIKTVQSSKEYVTISSIEQLDSNTPGKLIVYTLDSSDDENSFSLNSKVDEIKKLLGFQAEIELNKKLISKGYKKSEEYDNWKFAIKQKRTYLVDDTFPKIKRNMLSDAVIRAKYDLRIEELEGWIVDD